MITATNNSNLSIVYVIGNTKLTETFPITETTTPCDLHPFMDKTFKIIPSCKIDFIVIGTDVIDCRSILHDVITQQIADVSHNYI